MSELTQAQKYAIEVYNRPGTKLLLIDSVAGSGKSFTLVQIANLLHIKSGRCIVYNKSVADENKTIFPVYFESSTVHSLANQNTIKQFNLKVGYFNARDISEKISFEYKILTVQMLRQFCLSKYLKIDDFAKEIKMPHEVKTLVSRYMKKMKEGKIDVTHDFYMKFFHMLLANKILIFEEMDVLMLDESQDSFACTIEIFKLIPAKKKIAVGDKNQMLYSFNHCVNGFSVLDSENGVVLVNLDTTFRVNKEDAFLVQSFMREHLDQPDYSFIGNTHSNTEIKSRAYLTKTNSALIGKMIKLMEAGHGFKLLRPVKSIFELIMILLNLKKKGFIANPEFRHLQVEVDTWHNSRVLKTTYNSPLAYIASIYSNDVTIKTAVRIIIEHGPEKIFKVNAYAKKQSSKKNHEWTLSTVFTSKGFTFDYVEIAPDMNMAFEKALSDLKKNKINRSEFNDILYQYYVICTRSRISLINAIHLDKYRDNENTVNNQFNSVISKETKQLELDYE